ncbi:MAG: hypothetical protein NVSMB17_07760 [Candidatus Dormibacteria bacterium]
MDAKPGTTGRSANRNVVVHPALVAHLVTPARNYSGRVKHLADASQPGSILRSYRREKQGNSFTVTRGEIPP